MNTEDVRTVLAERAGSIDAARPERVDELFGRIRRHQRQRTAAAVAGATCLALALVAGVALLASGNRDAAPPPAGPDHKTHAPDNVRTRLAQRQLTYAMGSIIHWGDRTIDVAQQATSWYGRGKHVDYVDATDDGAVFVTGLPMSRDLGGDHDVWAIPNGPAAIWFTDGSAPVRIGTTFGDRAKGFEIASTTAGSTLAWTDPRSGTLPGKIVVYDTAQMREVARFGGRGAATLAVYDDVVYWTPAGTNCIAIGLGAAECQGTGPVMRFDTASGQQTRVSRALYPDRRARPGLLTGPHDQGEGDLFLRFLRRGDRLVADGVKPGVGSTPTVALTGRPLRLRMPAGDRNPDDLTLTQWLDPDRVVLVDNVFFDGTDLLICHLSTGDCQLAVRIQDAGNFTAPGRVVSH